MHDGPDSHVFLLAFAFVGILAMDNRIYRCFCTFIHLKVIERYHMQDTPGKAGSPLGHVDFVTVEFAGLLYGRIQTEVGVKLLWGGKQVKGAHFSNQDNRAEEANTPQGLEKEDAVIDSKEVKFDTLSGELTIHRNGNLYEMNFPTYELKEIPVTDAMERAFGARPVKAVLGLDLICIFDSEDTVRTMNPNQTLLAGIEGRIQNATSMGKETDCVSRSFCPKLSIPEDPVCGSAHCQIADYWSKELNKKEIYAYQASKRGGYLHCRMEENHRIMISGEATLVAISEIAVAL